MSFDWLRNWYYDQASRYPVRWYFPVIRIFGGPEGVDSRRCYMTRLVLSPVIRGRQLYFHIFHREDIDRDPHNHPFGFWTLPVNQSYIEEVYDSKSMCFSEQRVRRWRWNYRPATHIHRVVRTETGRWPLMTFVLRGPHEQPWGFFVHDVDQSKDDPERFWTPWQNYTDGAYTLQPNIEGRDDICPASPPSALR